MDLHGSRAEDISNVGVAAKRTWPKTPYPRRIYMLFNRVFVWISPSISLSRLSLIFLSLLIDKR